MSVCRYFIRDYQLNIERLLGDNQKIIDDYGWIIWEFGDFDAGVPLISNKIIEVSLGDNRKIINDYRLIIREFVDDPMSVYR